MNAFFYKLNRLIVRYLSCCLLVVLFAACITENNPVHQLSTSSNPAEGGSITPVAGEYDEGSELEIKATPNGNWMFVEWQGDHSGNQNPDTVTIDSDKSITALFQLAELSEDQFTGTYRFTQLEASTSVAGEFVDGWIFEASQTFTAEIVVNPVSTPNGRIFTVTPLLEFGEFDLEFPIHFEVNENPAEKTVTLEEPVSIEVYCGDDDESIFYGPAPTGNASSFDLADDSEFTLVIRENSNSRCNLGPEDITFRVTKVGSKATINKRLNLTNQSDNDNRNRIRMRLPNIN